MSRVESFNALIRGLVTLGMTAAFLLMVVKGQAPGDGFLAIYGSVLTFWFVSRERRADTNGAPPA